jgi:hypothetical protein
MVKKINKYYFVILAFLCAMPLFGQRIEKTMQNNMNGEIQDESEATQLFIKKINEVRDWKSMTDVRDFVSVLYEPPACDQPKYAARIIALSFGLRAVERVTETQKKYQHQDDAVIAQMENAAIKQKSAKEIALLGIMMVLSETVNVAPDGKREVLNSYLKQSENVEEVLDRRNQALEALRILLSPAEPKGSAKGPS